MSIKNVINITSINFNIKESFIKILRKNDKKLIWKGWLSQIPTQYLNLKLTPTLCVEFNTQHIIIEYNETKKN